MEADPWTGPFGAPHYDHILPLLLNDVHEGRIRLGRLVDMVCAMPAKIIGHYPHKGALAPGSSADLVLVDPEAEVRPEDGKMYSKSGWTPYIGWVLRGRPVLTMLRGQVIARYGEVVVEPGSARYVPGVPRPAGPIRRPAV
jgi:dihydroorotase-like cyclic amidohydrolase